LEDWGNRYIEHHEAAGCSLLIVHPTAKESVSRIIVLSLMGRPCKANSRWPWTLHINQTSPVNFWPQLFKVDQKPPLHRAAKIAAMTILMAGALHNSSVGKLQVYQFKEKWEPLGEEEINQIENEFLSIMDAIEQTVNG